MPTEDDDSTNASLAGSNLSFRGLEEEDQESYSPTTPD